MSGAFGKTPGGDPMVTRAVRQAEESRENDVPSNPIIRQMQEAIADLRERVTALENK